MSLAEANAVVIEVLAPAPMGSIGRWARRPLARWLFAVLAFAGAQTGILRSTSACSATASAASAEAHGSASRHEAAAASRQPEAPRQEQSSLPVLAAAPCGASVALPVERPVSAATAAAGGAPVQGPARVLTSVARAVPLPPPRSS